MIIYVIRHFEKDITQPTSPAKTVPCTFGFDVNGKHDLSTLGWQRANALTDFFPDNFGVPTAIYTFKINNDKSPGRGIETCTPLAKKYSITVQADHSSGDYKPAANTIADTVSGSKNLEDVYLLCWEHHRIPALVNLLLDTLAKKLNVTNMPDNVFPTSWADNNFDDVWKITCAEGVLKLEFLSHKLNFLIPAPANTQQALPPSATSLKDMKKGISDSKVLVKHLNEKQVPNEKSYSGSFFASSSHSAAHQGHKEFTVNSVPTQAQTFSPANGAYNFPIYVGIGSKNAALPLGAQDMNAITRVVIIQHGMLRNGITYFKLAEELINQNLSDTDNSVLLIAPNFCNQEDNVLPSAITWSTNGWMEGENSDDGSITNGVSSFQVLDDLLRWLNDKTQFPNLKHVVMAGHSAGGQLLQRYAVLNSQDALLKANGITFTYVIANPSSYLYFTPDRPTTLGGFSPRADIKGYDNYKYGIQGIAQLPYFNSSVPAALQGDPTALFNRYAKRRVAYLLGAADTDPHLRPLDKTPPAEAQGNSHYSRGVNYINYEEFLANKLLVPVVLNRFRYSVDNTGHDDKEMFHSQCSIKLLFGVNAGVNNNPSAPYKTIAPTTNSASTPTPATAPVLVTTAPRSKL